VKDILIGSDSLFLVFRSNFPKNAHVYECSNELQLRFCVALSIASGLYVIHRDSLWYLSQSSSANSESIPSGSNASVSLHCIRLKGSQDEHIHPINFKELTNNSSGIGPITFELNNERLLILVKLQGLARYVYFVYDVRQRQSAQLLHGPIVLEPDQQLFSSCLSSDGKMLAMRSADQLYLLAVGTQRPLQVVTSLQLSPESRVHFATDESRVLVVQTCANTLDVLLCWSRTAEDAVRVHFRSYEHKPLDVNVTLLGVRLPNIYVLRNETDSTGASECTLNAHVLTEFNGVGSTTISVMLDFLTAGQADLNAMIRRIARSGEQDERLWMNLARIAVKSANVKMGQYCASRLGWSFVVREVQAELKGDSFKADDSDDSDDERTGEDELDEEDGDELSSRANLNALAEGHAEEGEGQERTDKGQEEIRWSSQSERSYETSLDSRRSRESAALAVLASNLGLYHEAEQLLRKSGNSGKLVEFLTSRSDWDRAVKASERLVTRSVRYEYARYLEEEEANVTKAIEAYERAGCAASEVPRLLFDSGHLEQLKTYCLKVRPSIDSPDQSNSVDGQRSISSSEAFSEGWWTEQEQLVRWWAQYSESVGDLEEAVRAYEQAEDYANWVRLLCLGGSLDKAREVLADHEASASERLQPVLERVTTETSSERDVSSTDEIETMLIESEQLSTVSADQALRNKASEARLQRKDAALLYVARQLETTAPEAAVTCFLACGACQHAMKVCRQQDMQSQLIQIVAAHGSRGEVLETIDQLTSQLNRSKDELDETEQERPQQFEQLMQLHYRVGDLDSCVRFGLQGRLFSHVRALLQNEIERLDEPTTTDQGQSVSVKDIGADRLRISNKTLDVALELLRQNEQLVDLVVDLLLLRGEHAELIRDLIVEYRVRLDESFLNKVNRVIGLSRSTTPRQSRPLLHSLADCALQQGESLVAAKLFNAADDRPSAIRALARAGDTQRLITYTRIARDPVVYRVAANYLQTLNGSHESSIKEFYRKAGAKEELERYLNQNSSI
jgi:tetratricopeptide (TPR) repeat protein